MSRFFEGEWIRCRVTKALMLVVEECYTEGLAVLWFNNGAVWLTVIDDTASEKVPYEVVYADLEDAFRLVSGKLEITESLYRPELVAKARQVHAAAKVRYFLHQGGGA